MRCSSARGRAKPGWPDKPDMCPGCHKSLSRFPVWQSGLTKTTNGSHMQPTPETTQECLEVTCRQIGCGDVSCLLCGAPAKVAHCWIPTDRLQWQIHTPFNRSRTIGYGLCDRCDMCLTDDVYELITDKLLGFVKTTELFMPRSKLPAIFLN